LTAPTLPGARQALDRTQHVAVQLAGRRGSIPRANLLGALVIKSCAAAGDRTASSPRHREDLARLYALVPDPAALAAHVTRKDRQRLRAAPAPLWEVVPVAVARAAAQLAHRVLGGS
jgi:hypothetical protein